MCVCVCVCVHRHIYGYIYRYIPHGIIVIVVENGHNDRVQILENTFFAFHIALISLEV